MYDSLNDSWDGAEFCINSECVTLAYGASPGTHQFCVDMGSANSITMGGGSYPGEHSWELHDETGTLLFSGGDPYSEPCFGDCGVGGCMDPDCTDDYNPDATFDDFSCPPDDCAGVCGGSLVDDACGVWGVDGTACANCSSPYKYGDGWCNDSNNTPECGQDGGDCCPSDVQMVLIAVVHMLVIVKIVKMVAVLMKHVLLAVLMMKLLTMMQMQMQMMALVNILLVQCLENRNTL